MCFCVGLRGDPLHPAGGLPSFLGWGPAQAVPADQGRSVWCESPLLSCPSLSFLPSRCNALPSPPTALVPFWQRLRNSVTSFIFQGVQEREPHLRSHLTPCQIERERGTDSDSGLTGHRAWHLCLNTTGPDGFRLSEQIAWGCTWTGLLLLFPKGENNG